jgi:hypothetical protein
MCSIFNLSLHVVRIQRAPLIVIMDYLVNVILLLLFFCSFLPLTPRWLIYSGRLLMGSLWDLDKLIPLTE